MPTTPTYPGVYIEEVPSGVRTLVGVATSITAFIGRALRGPVNEPVRIQSYADYERVFGGLWGPSTMSYAVSHYFANGGTDAICVRLVNGATKATFALSPDPGGGDLNNLQLEARNEGAWGNDLRITVDHNTKSGGDDDFNLFVTEIDPTTELPRLTESHLNVSIDASAVRHVDKVLEQGSDLLRVDPSSVATVRPDKVTDAGPALGSDGAAVTFTEYEGSASAKTGIFALEKADLFNLLVIPPFEREVDVELSTWTAALIYCKQRRAMLLVDAPSGWLKVDDVTDENTGVAKFLARDENAAIYFPHLRMNDPLQENRLESFAPGGAVAGVFARTDAQRGVWKAPAGLEATLLGVRDLKVNLTDGENGRLNPLGVNCLRIFPVPGPVVWGARTLDGADQLASEWKYVPVRRIALFIEESLYRGTQWVVFEPNDEPLWSQIRLNVGAFMQNLFRQGAFQGQSPRQAYFVKCDKETTTQNDIDRGIVNVLVGFAPLKPAEFVIIKISQIAGQIQT